MSIIKHVILQKILVHDFQYNLCTLVPVSVYFFICSKLMNTKLNCAVTNRLIIHFKSNICSNDMVRNASNADICCFSIILLV
jgi:hypothetical protein